MGKSESVQFKSEREKPQRTKRAHLALVEKGKDFDDENDVLTAHTEVDSTRMSEEDRQELIEIFSQWYESVTIDEENQQIFLKRKKDDRGFVVGYDELQRVIDLNEESEDIREQEKNRDAIRHLETSLTRKEVTRPTNGGLQDADAPPTLTEIVDEQLVETLEKIRNLKYEVKLMPDGTTLELRRGGGVPFTIQTSQADRFVKVSERVRRDELMDLVRGPLKSRQQQREYPIVSDFVSQEELDARAQERASRNNSMREGEVDVSLTAPNVIEAIEKAERKARKQLRQLDKEIRNREQLTSDGREGSKDESVAFDTEHSNVEELRKESMQSDAEPDVVEAPSTEGLEVSEVDIDTLSPEEREALGLPRDTAGENASTDEPTPSAVPAAIAGGAIAVGAMNPPPRWQGGGAVPPPEAPPSPPSSQTPRREGDTPPPTPPPPGGGAPRTPPPEGPRGDVGKIRKQIRILEDAKANVSYTSQEFRSALKKANPELLTEWEKVSKGGEAASIIWIERKLASLKNERMATAAESPSFFDARFEAFGVKQEDIESIPGYENLTPGQRMLLFENFRDYMDDTKAGIGGHLWSYVRSAFGNPRDPKLTKSKTSFDAPNFADHKDILTTFVGIAEKYGPKKVHIEGGEARADFVGLTPAREHREKELPLINALNRTAHQFAKIPWSHQADGHGVHSGNESGFSTYFKEKLLGGTKERQEYLAYEKMKGEYERAKERLSAQLLADGVPAHEVVATLLQVDAQVRALRFIETNPEAVDLLKREGPPSLWQKGGRFALEAGIYGGLGATSRIMIGGALGVLGGPAVAGTLAGIKSWNKTAALQRERDRALVMGQEHPDNTRISEKRDWNIEKTRKATTAEERMKIAEDDSFDTRLNVVAAKQTIQTSEGEKEMGLIARLEEKIGRCESLKNGSDPEGRKQYIRALNSLNGHITYAHDKFMLNRIQFGDKDTFATNQEEFLLILSKAQVFMSEAKGSLSEDELREVARLGEKSRKYMMRRDELISNRRHKEQRKEVYKAAAIAASFSGAFGYLYANYAHEPVKGAFGKVGAWLGFGEVSLKETSQVAKESVEKSSPMARAGGATGSWGESVNIPKGDGGNGMETLIETLKSSGVLTDTQQLRRSLAMLPPDVLREVGIQNGKLSDITPGTKINVELLKQYLGIRTDVEIAANIIGGGTGTGSEVPKDNPGVLPSSSAKEVDINSLIPDKLPSYGPSDPMRGLEREVLAAQSVQEPSRTPEKHVFEGLREITADDRKHAEILQLNYLQRNVPGYEWHNKIKNMDAEVFMAAARERGGGGLSGGAQTLGRIFNTLQQPPYGVIPEQRDTVDSYMRRAFAAIAQADDDKANTTEVRNFIRKNILNLPPVTDAVPIESNRNVPPRSGAPVPPVGESSGVETNRTTPTPRQGTPVPPVDKSSSALPTQTYAEQMQGRPTPGEVPPSPGIFKLATPTYSELVKLGDKRPGLLSYFLESGRLSSSEMKTIKGMDAKFFVSQILTPAAQSSYPPELVRFGRVLSDMQAPPYNLNIDGLTVDAAMNEAHAMMVIAKDQGGNTPAVAKYLELAERRVPKAMYR